MAPDRRDRRGVSITVNHVFAIGITSILLVGLFASFGGFVESHVQQAGEKELRVIGERIAAEIQVADRIARGGGTVSLRVTQPPRVSSGAYSVRLLHGSACHTDRFVAESCLRLSTRNEPVSVKVPVANHTMVSIRSVGAGTFVITAGAGSGSATAGGDVTENVGIDVGVGRRVRPPSTTAGNYTFRNRPPVAKFNYTPTNPSVGSIIRFNATATDLDGTITKYEWDLDGDGSVEKTGESFNYSYATPGKYNATLTVTDNQGETDSISVLIVVSGLVYNYDATATDYDGDGVPGGVNFNVTNLHGDVTVTHVSIEPHDDGITGLDVDVPGDGPGQVELYFEPGSGSDEHVDDALDLSGDGVIVDLSYSESTGEPTFDVGEVMEIHLSEFRAGGGAVNMTDREVDVAIRYYVDSGGTRNYSVAKFTLFTNSSRNKPPIPSMSVSCSGRTCQFDGSGSSDDDGTIVAYNWTFGDGTTGNGVSVSHTYPTNDTYQVTLTVTDDDGTSTSVTRTVLVGAVDFDLQVNFQPPGVPTPPGYVADTGAVYGPRGNGYTYGWNALADERVDRDFVADQKLDTFIYMQHPDYGSDRAWEVEVPDGTYRVYLVMGDEYYAYDDSVVVEGEPIADPDPYEYADHDRYVTVADVDDGRLTIRPGPGAQYAKINYVRITRVDTRPYQEESGRVVIEAEHYQDVRQGTDDMSGTSFVPESDPAASGKTLHVRPNLGENADDTRNGQRLDFEVDFDTTGTYYVWVRMKCPSEDDDSIHVGLDGNAVTLGGYGLTVGCDGAGGYTWVYQQYDPPPGGWDTTPVTVEVTSPGVHTFNIWVREDGVYVDKILLTTAPPTAYTPSGEGPEESDQS